MRGYLNTFDAFDAGMILCAMAPLLGVDLAFVLLAQLLFLVARADRAEEVRGGR
jgi:hypothetical protein